jgi:hypothetical protein
VLLNELNARRTIARIMNLKALAGELSPKGSANIQLVVHNEDGRSALFQEAPRGAHPRRGALNGLIINPSMDDTLFQRFLSGDPHAATGVRNHLRAVAHRVLASPQWGLADNESRREREMAAVAETLQSPGHSMVQAASRVMAVTTRIGLEQLRTKEGIPQGHVRADLLARKAMDSLQEDEEEPLRHYLESCTTCSRHLELARLALKASISAQTMAPAPTVQSPQFGTPGRIRSATPPRLRKPDRKRHPKLSKGPGIHSSELITRAVMLIGLGLGIFFLTRPSADEFAQEETLVRSRLLPAELPPTVQAGNLGDNVAASVRLMNNGRCADAASRLARFVERDPELRLLRYYYSLALLCDRQGSAAMQSFASLRAIEGQPYWGEKWWYAQALYLTGSTETAMSLLDQIVEDKHGRAADAEALLQQIIARN